MVYNDRRGDFVGYVDIRYYRKVFGGEFAGSDKELLKLVGIASDKVDELVFGRIGIVGFERLSEFQKKCVKRAVCFQVDFYVRNGIDGGGAVVGYKVLDVNVSYARSSRVADRERFSDLGYGELVKSGLVYRQI